MRDKLKSIEGFLKIMLRGSFIRFYLSLTLILTDRDGLSCNLQN